MLTAIIKLIFKLIRSCLGINKNDPNPIEWKITAIKNSFNAYEIHMVAFIAHSWKLYAQESTLEGPLATIIKFEENSFINLIGQPKEIGTIKEEYEENFNAIAHYYNTAVDFVQEVRVYTSQSEILKGEITYMTCSEKQSLKQNKMKFELELN